MRAFERLRDVLPAPESSVDAGSWKDWSRIYHAIGTPLPHDYQWYIETYGSGMINDFLTPFNPFAKNYHLNLLDQWVSFLQADRQLRQQFGAQAVPYPLYFEPGGLFPWGYTHNGDNFHWLTRGDNPDNWVVVINARSGEWFEYEEGMTELVRKLIIGEIHNPVVSAFLFAPTGQGIFTPLTQ